MSIPWEDRDIDLLLTGSLFLPPEAQKAAWCDHGAAVERKLNDIADLVCSDLARPLEESVREVLGEDVDFETLYPYMKTVDDYIRNALRVDSIVALAYLRPTVDGPGWKAYNDKLLLVRFLEEKSIKDAVKISGRARVILNPFPGYNDSHERVFNAMASGCAVISSRSVYYESEFSSENIFFLPNCGLDMQSALTDLMVDNDRIQVMAASGQRRVLNAHTWMHRARSLANIGKILPKAV